MEKQLILESAFLEKRIARIIGSIELGTSASLLLIIVSYILIPVEKEYEYMRWVSSGFIFLLFLRLGYDTGPLFLKKFLITRFPPTKEHQRTWVLKRIGDLEEIKVRNADYYKKKLDEIQKAEVTSREEKEKEIEELKEFL